MYADSSQMPSYLPGFIMQVISEMTFSSSFVHFEISFATRQKVIQFYEPQFGFSLALWTYDRSQKCLKIIPVEARCSLW